MPILKRDTAKFYVKVRVTTGIVCQDLTTHSSGRTLESPIRECGVVVDVCLLHWNSRVLRESGEL